MFQKFTFKKISIMLIALMLCGFSVALFLLAKLGSDTVSIFVDGVAKTVGVRYGSAALVFNGIIIILGFVLAPKNMGLFGIVYSLLVGYVIDFFLARLGGLNIASMHLTMRVLVVVAAQLLLTLSYALLILLDLGMNPLDAMAYGLADRFKKDYRFTRIAMDVTMFSIGFLLGGIAGVGTIFAVATTGPIVSFYVKKGNLLKEKRLSIND